MNVFLEIIADRTEKREILKNTWWVLPEIPLLAFLLIWVLLGGCVLAFCRFSNTILPVIIIGAVILILAEIIRKFPSKNKAGIYFGSPFPEAVRELTGYYSLARPYEEIRIVTGGLRDFGLVKDIDEHKEDCVHLNNTPENEKKRVIEICQDFIAVIESLHERNVNIEIIWGYPPILDDMEDSERKEGLERQNKDSDAIAKWLEDECKANMIHCKKRPRRHFSTVGKWGYRWEKKHQRLSQKDRMTQRYDAIINTQSGAGVFVCQCLYWLKRRHIIKRTIEEDNN